MDVRSWSRWWRLVGKAGAVNVLSHDWDPIGLADALPGDQYESAAGRVAGLLRDAAPVDHIAEQLSEYRTGWLGLDPDPTADRRAALALVDWYTRTIEQAQGG